MYNIALKKITNSILLILCIFTISGCSLSISAGGTNSKATGGLGALFVLNQKHIVGVELVSDFSANTAQDILDYIIPRDETYYTKRKKGSEITMIAYYGRMLFVDWFGIYGGLGYSNRQIFNRVEDSTTGSVYEDRFESISQLEFGISTLFIISETLGVTAGYYNRRGATISLVFPIPLD